MDGLLNSLRDLKYLLASSRCCGTGKKGVAGGKPLPTAMPHHWVDLARGGKLGAAPEGEGVTGEVAECALCS